MLKTILGTKKDTFQTFDGQGRRLVLTRIQTEESPICRIKTKEKDGYLALQLGYGEKKIKRGADKKTAPLYLREVEITEEDLVNLKVGGKVNVTEALKPGDEVKVTGISKGKGFAGVVKRWHFKGGPRTHGQSDRERAPGAIGMTTTPGRVFKGKKMAGRMGNDRVAIKGLTVVSVDKEGIILVSGLLPGIKNGLVMITKTGENKKFVPLKTEETSAQS